MSKEKPSSLFDRPDASGREILDVCATQRDLDPLVRYTRTIYAYYDGLADPNNDPTLASDAAFAAACYAPAAGHDVSSINNWLSLANSLLPRPSGEQSIAMHALQRSLGQAS